MFLFDVCAVDWIWRTRYMARTSW